MPVVILIVAPRVTIAIALSFSRPGRVMAVMAVVVVMMVSMVSRPLS